MEQVIDGELLIQPVGEELAVLRFCIRVVAVPKTLASGRIVLAKTSAECKGSRGFEKEISHIEACDSIIVNSSCTTCLFGYDLACQRE